MNIKVKGACVGKTPRKDGRYQGYYIIDNQKYFAYGQTYQECFNKVLEMVKNGVKTKPKIPITFSAFFEYYFEKFRKKKIAPSTYKNDFNRFNFYLKPYFKERRIKSITPAECQELLDDIQATGKGKTADEIFSLLSITFKGAIMHDIINKNPLNIVFRQPHERKHGKALTLQEEKTFINAIKGTKFERCFAVALYTGLRPNELKTAEIHGEMIIAVNSKRKNKKIEYKRIPICDKLRPFLPLPHFPGNLDELRRELKIYLPNHILYDLRTTFYNRLKECCISEYAIKEFMGHSLDSVSASYTDLSDEFLIAEMKNFNY